ncbi:MAG: outer membrane beta-barrel protein [Cystobacter sp.]
MKTRTWMKSVAVLSLCLSGPTLAASAERVARNLNFNEAETPVGLDVRLGAGGLTGSAAEYTKVGPLLGLTAGAQPWRLLGIEAGFEGQRLPLSDTRIGQGEAMYRYNLGVLAKAGPLLVQEKLRPYVGVGAGVSYLNATSGAEGLYRNDFVSEVPFAAGLDYRFGNGLFAGARASYRVLFGEEFADAANLGEPSGGNLLNVAATVGGRF